MSKPVEDPRFDLGSLHPEFLFGKTIEADDRLFFRLWPTVESFIEDSNPQFLLLQCGADGLADDPLTHLRLSRQVHRRVTADLCRMADKQCNGRLLALGGGGYDRGHTAQAWVEVIRAMVEHGVIP